MTPDTKSYNGIVKCLHQNTQTSGVSLLQQQVPILSVVADPGRHLGLPPKPKVAVCPPPQERSIGVSFYSFR